MGLDNLGTVSYQLRDYSEAIAYYEEALALNRQFGNATWMAYNLGNLAEAYNAVGDAPRALKLGVESFEILVANQDRPVLSQLLLSLAVSLCQLGEAMFEAQLYGFQRQLLEELQMSIPPNEVAEYEKGLASCRTSLGEDQFLIEFESGSRLALDDVRQLLRT